jgi:hypothetical protein
LDDVNRAHAYVVSHAYAEPKQVHIYWTAGYQSGFGCNNVSCFGPVSGSPNGFGVFIQDALAEMPDVVVHEIGHAYRYNLTSLWASSCPNGEHSTWVRSNLECAWQEGWADFLPTLVNNDPCYDDNSGFPPCGILASNLETPHPRDGLAEGDAVEGRVAGALLDLHDTIGSPPGDNDEGWDNASDYGFWRTWSILNPTSEPSPELTIPDFYNHWNSYSNFASASPIIGPLYQNTIKYPVFVPLVLNDYTESP